MKKTIHTVKELIATAFLVIDLFCGAGGTTTGFAASNGAAKVIACVNHDKNAIVSHWQNHPEVKHFEEDIRTLDLTELIKLTKRYREIFPNAKVILWASLECTNFSKAKGGKARDADSRTLADHLHRYIVALEPEIIQIENVVEFMSWGPLDENGKPVSKKNGQDFIRWRSEIKAYGYFDEWREMNAADFGAYTSRNRLFGMFARSQDWIVWPEPTHLKNPGKGGLFAQAEKWKPVKEVLDFEDEGNSIFGRKKDLSPKTMERIYAGLIKYVANGDTSFLKKYFSGRPSGKVTSTNSPSGVITTFCNQQLVQVSFLQKHNTGNPYSMVTSVDDTAGTLTTKCHQSKVCATFLTQYNGNSGCHSLEQPANTLSTKDRLSKVQCNFIYNKNSSTAPSVSVEKPSPTITQRGQSLVQPIWLDKKYSGTANHQSINNVAGTILTKDKYGIVRTVWLDKRYNGSHSHQSVNVPAGTIMAVDKHCLVSPKFLTNLQYKNKGASIDQPSPTLVASRRHYYLVNPQWGSSTAQSVEKPCFTLIARMDKAPPSVVMTEAGEMAIEVLETDCEATVRIKQFMAVYGIVDIKMRMLKIPELLKIQGFPNDYKLHGTQTDQKKFIGNSVCPDVVRSWILAINNATTKIAA